MTYFKTKELVAITLLAALWGILNAIFAPIFFRAFSLPLLCDFIGFATLTIAAWWIRKPGALTFIGLVATAISFIINPAGIQFLGFTVASIAFDLALSLIGYNNIFKRKTLVVISIIPISTISAALAGFLIGSFFVGASNIAFLGGVAGWVIIHATGGIIGGIIGVLLVFNLISRKILVTPLKQ